MNYKTKLDEFNQTRKYANEIELLSSLVPRLGKSLDYGCGTGTGAVMMRINGHKVDGYDATQHNKDFKYTTDPNDFYNSVYFMHSLAHISNAKEVLIERRRWLRGNARIVVITPNLDWLERQYSDDYTPDPTVISHYTEQSLIDLFESAGYSVVNSGQFGQRIGCYNERLFLVAKRDKYKSVNK
jgi:2-polyprenyl-3-methyl-5-hydroxy-6-metoxy-1,4-benzoquinol methylase